MTPSELHRIVPTLPEPRLSEYCAILTSELHAAGIIDRLEIAAFISQAAHESAGFSRFEENLYYTTAQRILQIWPNRFSGLADAAQYTRNPAKLANRVYANRLGNGDEASGDGYKHRGRGALHVTGKTHYLNCGNDIGLDLINNPDQLLLIVPAIKSAIWFWKINSLGVTLASAGIRGVSKKISGSATGIDDRIARFEIALQALA